MASIFNISDNELHNILVSTSGNYQIPQNVIKIVDGTTNSYPFIRIKDVEFNISFQNNSQIKIIGQYSFYSCHKLKCIDFNNAQSLTEIGSHAFDDCSSLRSIVLPNSLIKINAYAFWNCISLSSLTIFDESSLTDFGTGVFAGCSIDTFTIPKHLKSKVDTGTFFARNPIIEFKVHPQNTYFKAYNGSLFSFDYTTLYCHQKYIPLSLHHSTTTIARSAFSGYKLSLIVPHQINELDNNAFYNYQGKSITLYSDFELIKESAFGFTSQLIEVKFFGLVSVIEDRAFYSCGKLNRILFSILPNSIATNAFPSDLLPKICFYGEVSGIEKQFKDLKVHKCTLLYGTCIVESKRKINNRTFFTLILFSTL